MYFPKYFAYPVVLAIHQRCVVFCWFWGVLVVVFLFGVCSFLKTHLLFHLFLYLIYVKPLRTEEWSKLKGQEWLWMGFIAFQFLVYFGSCVHWITPVQGAVLTVGSTFPHMYRRQFYLVLHLHQSFNIVLKWALWKTSFTLFYPISIVRFILVFHLVVALILVTY